MGGIQQDVLLSSQACSMQNLLANYRKLWIGQSNSYANHSLDEERLSWQTFCDFYQPDSKLFCRSHLPGHFTGSALIVNATYNRVLLTLHAKLHQWFQLGGHADGDQDIAAVALREAEEESGLRDFSFADLRCLLVSDGADQQEFCAPFDLDRHYIPPSHKEPGHYHYDVVFLLVADDQAPLQITAESKDLRWFTLPEAREVTAERSMLRQFDKLASLSRYLQ